LKLVHYVFTVTVTTHSTSLDRFCECHLGDQYLMLTKHLLRLLNIEILNFQPQTKFLHHWCHRCISMLNQQQISIFLQI